MALSIAPMMERTDRHFRYLMRQITKRTLLYTEMVVAKAIIHGDKKRHLDFSEIEKPLSLQLGGSDPKELAECAKIAEDWGYNEVNLNVGCPSDRVQSGAFGAVLMKSPKLVAECVDAMQKATKLPVSVKHRIGVDDTATYEFMEEFVRTVAQTGCRRFTVHARAAWLQGLDPKQNREIPPLRYDDVYRLKAEHPELMVEINGGIKSLEETRAHLQSVDAVMIGRAAYDNPFLFAQADTEVLGALENPGLDRIQVAQAMVPYVERMLAEGHRLSSISRHMLNLMHGQPGARAWRRLLTEGAAVDNHSAGPLRQGIAWALEAQDRSPGE